jgi:Dullard-like phosphatase family protein
MYPVSFQSLQESNSEKSLIEFQSNREPIPIMSILRNIRKKMYDIIEFNSGVLITVPFIDHTLNLALRVDVLVNMLAQTFPVYGLLLDSLNQHLDLFAQFIVCRTHSNETKLKVFTKRIVQITKQIISRMIGQNLEPKEVFVLLTCTELFQFVNKIPLELIISALNNCYSKRLLITSTVNLPSFYSLICSVAPPYLPKYAHKEYTLVLDLDETLGHYSNDKFTVRPGVQEFLRRMQEIYELVLFTGSTREYADWAMSSVDPNGIVLLRLYRQHTTDMQFKDLSKLGRDLEKVIIVDNFSKSYEKHPKNGIEIKSWIGDENDKQLIQLIQPLCSIHLIRNQTLEQIICLINSYFK